MSDWASGYVADVDYVAGFYPEQMPSHLDTICFIRGVHPPRRPGDRFTYCELGCGLGETALTLAACHPEAEIHAFDFNPGHIAYAGSTARKAGLANVHFAERSFGDLAHAHDDALPRFDYVTLHGVWTWVARARQLEIMRFLARFVRPGGVVAVSYNSQPGWNRGMPIQRLLFDFASESRGRSDQRAGAALDFVEAAAEAGSPAINENFLKGFFTKHGRQSPYLSHEYLNGPWQPAYHADVAADLAEAKLSYVGSATALENFPQLFLTEKQQQFVAAAPAAMAETLFDFFNPRAFRRDVFVRGPRSMAAPVKARMLAERQLAPATPKIAFKPKLALPHGEIEFNSAFYPYMAVEMSKGTPTVAALREGAGAPPAPSTEEILAVGLEKGSALLVERGASASEGMRVRRINLAFIGNAIEHGQAQTALAAPAIASGLRTPLVSLLAYEALATGTPENAEALAARCAALLAERGERLHDRDKVLDTAEAMMPVFSRAANEVLAETLPLWRRLGAF